MRNLAILTLLVALASPTTAEPKIECEMKFTLRGWSFGFRSANGAGTVTCSNGETFPVKLRIRGAGFTVGKSVIEDGRGTFSSVARVDEILGGYAAAEAAAGVVKSAGGQVLTKGEVSLALGGTGRGWDLGVSIGRLQITRE
ncbi:MAG: hypothetical protein FJ091_04600 [Deltaproteobacteria bacterium]|nr:hypothetical protein [Deltaproteobacteria bacterium]